MRKIFTMIAALMLTQSNLACPACDEAAAQAEAAAAADASATIGDAVDAAKAQEASATKTEAEPEPEAKPEPIEPTVLDGNNFFDLVVDNENKIVKDE